MDKTKYMKKRPLVVNQYYLNVVSLFHSTTWNIASILECCHFCQYSAYIGLTFNHLQNMPKLYQLYIDNISNEMPYCKKLALHHKYFQWITNSASIFDSLALYWLNIYCRHNIDKMSTPLYWQKYSEIFRQYSPNLVFFLLGIHY